MFLGAAAVLSNGTVLSRAGTAASITHNELGDPEALAAVPGKPEMNALEVGWLLAAGTSVAG